MEKIELLLWNQSYDAPACIVACLSDKTGSFFTKTFCPSLLQIWWRLWQFFGNIGFSFNFHCFFLISCQWAEVEGASVVLGAFDNLSPVHHNVSPETLMRLASAERKKLSIFWSHIVVLEDTSWILCLRLLSYVSCVTYKCSFLPSAVMTPGFVEFDKKWRVSCIISHLLWWEPAKLTEFGSRDRLMDAQDFREEQRPKLNKEYPRCLSEFSARCEQENVSKYHHTNIPAALLLESACDRKAIERNENCLTSTFTDLCEETMFIRFCVGIGSPSSVCSSPRVCVVAANWFYQFISRCSLPCIESTSGLE